MKCKLILLTIATLALQGQDEDPLKRIKVRMKQNLARIPSYTCLETVSRSQRAPDRYIIAVPGKSVPFRRLDVVRFEVAEVKNTELFAKPGEHNFENKELRDLAPTGLIGNGIFSGFARDVVRPDIATPRFAGEESTGRKLLHYDYEVPLFLSGYRVGSNTGQALVGYHGSFWADAETLDTVRLDVIADDIPRVTGLTNIWNRVDFARVHIGGSDALLPQSAEMTSRVMQGWESRNQISFTHCREYGVESVISYEDPGDSGNAIATRFVDLPAGLQITLKLESAIDSHSTQVGDPLTAVVDVDARLKGKLAVPKDAVITGRLRRMELHKEGWPYVLTGLEFTQVEFEGKQARFFAELEKLILPPGAEGPRRLPSQDLPGVGLVTAKGNNLRLPEGTRMIWKTLSYEQAAEMAK